MKHHPYSNAKKKQEIVEHVVYEILGKGDLSSYERLVAKDVKVHSPPVLTKLPSNYLLGREKVQSIDQECARAFTVKNVKINEMICDHNKIAIRWSLEGRQKGDFFELKASHHDFHLTGQTIYQLNEENKIGEVWQAWDMLGLVRQLQDRSLSQEQALLKKRFTLLSKREEECLKYLLLGKTAKETASCMGISFRTVEYYFENIKDKLGCFSKKDVFACARQLEKQGIL